MTGPTAHPPPVLGLHVDAATVRAVVVEADGGTAGAAARDWDGAAPERLWAAVLAATRDVLALHGTAPGAIGLSGDHDLLLVWDADTLGAARPVDPAAGSTAALLAHLAAAEPHTWALVEEGRYVVGPAAAYVLARATRGTWAATDAVAASRSGLWDDEAGAWDPARCAAAGLPAGLADLVLPEVLPSWGAGPLTDAGSFLGLALPVAGLAETVPATRVAGDLAVADGADPAGAAGPAYGVALLAALGAGLATWAGPDPATLARLTGP